ncbi:MAG: 5-oxoprolinase subunit PxpB [Phycisphaeraceae bacterium]|nr:5-oxoprolinase subunit PxpB [Phycisphaeraceae bacterium]
MTEPVPAITLSWLGDCCLRVGFGENATDSALASVRSACEQLQNARLEEIVDLTPAFHTLLIRFDPRADLTQVESRVRMLMNSIHDSRNRNSSRLIEIPVCYELGFAPDLEVVAAHCNLSVADIVSRHAAAEYCVAFIGFTPGFAYLTGLPKSLHAPRLERPRVRVPSGSVGIAGDQTGIYPRETPGGWKLIGRSPLRMFDASKPSPSLLAAGDRVRFKPVDAAQFRALAEKEQTA